MSEKSADGARRKLLEPGEMFGDYTVEKLFASGSVRPVPGLVEYLARRTENYSGADLKGLVDSIRQLAYDRHVPLYTHSLADEALAQVSPSAMGSILEAIREWENRRS